MECVRLSIGGSRGDGQANGVFFAEPFRFGIGEGCDYAVTGTHRAAHLDLQSRGVMQTASCWQRG